MITPRNILRHELIGLEAEVVEASNPSLVGLRGRIVDETRHMLTILTSKGLRRIQKRCTVFRIRLPDGSLVDLNGSVIDMQPERRIVL